MTETMKELVAIGTAMGVHCQPCLSYHVNKARGMGIAEDDIREAINIGHTVGKGAMSAMQEYSKGVLEDEQ